MKKLGKMLTLVGVISLMLSGVGSAGQQGNPLTQEQMKQLNAVKGATAKYHDVNKAIADGYRPVGDCTNAEDIPPLVELGIEGTMGIHYFNPKLIDNPELTGDKLLIPEQPELLLYTRDKNGNLKLVGVEYMVSEDEWKALHPEEFSREEFEGSGLTDEEITDKIRERLGDPLRSPKPTIMGFTFEGLMGPHGPGEPWHFDKHIWLFNDNPSGIDAQWNPSCTCEPEQDKDKKPFKHSH